MQPTSANFIANARDAIADDNLQLAIARVGENFGAKRQQAVDKLPEFDALCGRAVEIKDDVLAHLDYYLEVYERAVTASGGHVHWCATVEEACETVLRLCRSVDAKTVTKGKSMIGEEMEINPYLERHGIEPIETDLGEYIIQLAGEPPSHIIAPAVHKTKEQVTDLFHEHHRKFGKTERLTEGEDLVAEARELLRGKYLAADVGITGANFLIAETGSSIIVTNEGNGDLTQMLPKMHIVLASLEKVVPTLEDAATLLRLLARSASGQEMSSYTTLSTGPRRADDPDGPGEYHVVLLDNGRSELLGGEFQDILRCIRCGACYNHCPVYTSVGGHAYGWVYGGPMGAVLTPALIGLAEARHLPSATPFCGRCEEVCPMQIPLPKMMRHWREQSFQRRLTPGRERLAVALWAWFARRPALYHLGARFAIGWLFRRARGRGHMRKVPFMRGWTLTRDLPAPEGGTFQQQWRRRKRA
ncbi:MAG: iron-sulfur cluster-binding protein [Proteobacteria bacterium]|nr:iron-sulfur cluster-binding protein [Pseudomonadota bacterium]